LYNIFTKNYIPNFVPPDPPPPFLLLGKVLIPLELPLRGDQRGIGGEIQWKFTQYTVLFSSPADDWLLLAVAAKIYPHLYTNYTCVSSGIVNRIAEQRTGLCDQMCCIMAGMFLYFLLFLWRKLSSPLSLSNKTRII